tara:strand:- start:17379 stop:18665 length:1287 start_codon:yes stop_codon:yes gene_type:complete
MSDVLLTLNQRYTMGIESGSTVIVDSTDGAEGKQIFRNNMIISGAHDPTVFGDVPTVTLLKGQNLGLNIIDTGSVPGAAHAQLRLTCLEEGDAVMQYYGNFGGATPTFTTGIDASDGCYKIDHATTLVTNNSTPFSIHPSQNIVTMSADVYIDDDLKVGGDIYIVDDLIVGDCAHIDALHVGTGTDTDPGDGDVTIDSNLYVGNYSEFNGITKISQSAGTTTGHYLYVDVKNSTYSAQFRNGVGANSENYEGIKIQCGQNVNNSVTMVWTTYSDGDGTSLDYMKGDGAGGVKFTGQAHSTYCDIRNKNSVVPIEESSLNPQDILNNINIFEFKYNSYDWMTDEIKNKKDTERRIGVIAQEMESTPLAYTVEDNDAINEKENKPLGSRGFKYKEVRYKEIVPLLIQTSKEQYSRIIELENRIKVLEEKA